MTEPTNTTILLTKITLPVLKETHIVRSRLLESLTAGLTGRLTLISAPAGFGKTTLLTQWAHSGQMRCVWLSLDDMDNDPVRFWRYVIHTVAPALAASARERVFTLAQAMPGLSVHTFLDSFINELFALPDNIAILLDDYHVIRDTHIHDSLAYFIDYLPQTVHMIIASRAELPFSTAKWVSRNEHRTIAMEQLQFTQDETEQFYVNADGIKLSHQQIEQLHLRTEGWAAGLQLTALSLRSKNDYDRYIQEFHGDHRNVSDLLFHEVMASLPEELQEFLVTTSVLPKMNARIADAVTHRVDSWHMLETIKRSNLFLVSLDDRNNWFRYHHLFAQFLQVLLKNNGIDKWLAANRAASESFAAHGLMDEAIHHALAAEDYDLAQKQLERHIPDVLRRGENETLLHWFRSIPDEVTLAPDLSLLYAFVLVLTGMPDEADRLLEKVERACHAIEEADRKGQLQSGILFVRANLMFMNGDFEKWLGFVEGILSNILPENAVFYNYNYNLSEPLVRRTPLGLKGIISKDTETIGRMFIGVLESHGWTQSLINLYVKQSLCEGYYEWNRLDICRELISELEPAAGQMEVPGLAIPLAITQARLYLADHRPQLAHERILEAMRTASDARWLHLLQAFQIRVYLLEDQTAQAKKAMAKLGLSVKDKPAFDQEYMYMTLVRLLGKQRKEAEALRLLDLMKPQTAREQLVSSLVEIAILQALLEEQRGQRNTALLHIHTALTLGEQNGYVRSFLDEGMAMKSLLMHYLHVRMEDSTKLPISDVTEDYVRKLIEAFPDGESPLHRETVLTEPLNRSELNLLRLLNQGATNKQMAQELALSAGTVRVYLSRMYDKLGVSSRTQALIAARNLGLLD